MLRSLLLVLGLVVIALNQRVPAAETQGHRDAGQEADNASESSIAESGQGQHYNCRVNEMPISWATRGQPVKIVHSAAVFTELGTGVPALDVLNTEAAPITNLAFVVEYLDSEGRKATTVAVAAAAAGYEKSMKLPFSVENIESWKEPLEPGKTGRVSGFYDNVRTTTCPESGHITFVMAGFKNGTIQQFATDGWSVPPLPRFVPELNVACPKVEKNPTEVRAKLRISSRGDVIGLSGPVLTKDNPDLVTWIATQMKQWKFQPSLLNGRPREDNLDVEFVVYGDPEPNLAAITVDSPRTLIVFFPRRSGCVESFGFLHEATTVP